MNYLLHLFIMVCIYHVLALSLDLVSGRAGILSLAQGAFFGLGAYTSALLTTRFGVPTPAAWCAACALGCLASLAVSLPSLRLSGDYFVIATFGFQMIAYNLMNNWTELTGGAAGVPGIPRPVLFGWPVETARSFAVVAAAYAMSCWVMAERASSGPFGRVLRAIREDEDFARSLGKDTPRFKVVAVALGSTMAAGSGALYAHYITYIDPSNFTSVESILVISMVAIGGADSPFGPLIGAALLVLLPEGLRFLGLTTSTSANLRQIIYGAILVGVVTLRPRGMAGRFSLGG